MSDSLPQPGLELAGKVALVTGGARNIGRAIAQALAAGSAAVMVNANTSEAAARETVNLIEDTGGKAAYCIADITQPDAVARLVDETVARFGRLDMLVNNAGVRAETPFESMTYAEWRSILSVILDGAFLCSRACVPHMIEAGGGTIINIGGQTGHSGAAHRAHVIAAKSGIAGLTKGLAHDLAPHHITVNNVVPGLIDTVRGIPGAPERPASRSAPPPVGRLGRPEEVAAMVRMLCGPGGRYITGQSIHVNGGGLMP
jgi:3-oxoacyl-[acyl-carrier protein] reductase